MLSIKLKKPERSLPAGITRGFCSMKFPRLEAIFVVISPYAQCRSFELWHTSENFLDRRYFSSSILVASTMDHSYNLFSRLTDSALYIGQTSARNSSS